MQLLVYPQPWSAVFVPLVSNPLMAASSYVIFKCRQGLYTVTAAKSNDW